jgi:predicted ATPase
VEVKPPTIFIGRNSVGKSLIAQTLWALAIYLYPFSIYYWKAHRGIASSSNMARD